MDLRRRFEELKEQALKSKLNGKRFNVITTLMSCIDIQIDNMERFYWYEDEELNKFAIETIKIMLDRLDEALESLSE